MRRPPPEQPTDAPDFASLSRRRRHEMEPKGRICLDVRDHDDPFPVRLVVALNHGEPQADPYTARQFLDLVVRLNALPDTIRQGVHRNGLQVVDVIHSALAVPIDQVRAELFT